MHAVAFGTNYETPFLHCCIDLTKAVAWKRSVRGDRNCYLVKIDVRGLTGSQRGGYSQISARDTLVRLAARASHS